MKKTTGIAILAAAVPLALSLATAQPARDLPPGIAAGAWISLGPDAGFVVTQSGSTNPLERRSNPHVHGYLMARQDGKWLRLDPDTPAGRLSPTTN